MKELSQEKLTNIEQTILNKKFKELNSLCSYLAMFPSEVPRKFIEAFTDEGDLVYEPFSGRGTTTLEAIRLNRRVVSSDLSPLAYVLTKSKTHYVKHEDVVKEVRRLENEYNKNKSKYEVDLNDEKFNDIKVFYSIKNLNQLNFIREKLGKKYKNLNHVRNYILAVSLGIAHGQTRKTGDKNNSLYFSVSMPNGMSMAPGYAERYIKKNSLHKIETNLFDQIIERAEKKKAEILESEHENVAHLHDALKGSELFENEKPKLIFTSPPYLNLIKYVDQNWIRFWILGFDRREKRTVQMVDDYHGRKEYIEFIKNFMIEMHKIMSMETKLILVIGDVKTNYIREIMNEIFEDERINSILKFDNENLFKNENPVEQKLRNKLSRQMGNKVGNATESDWVFGLRRK